MNAHPPGGGRRQRGGSFSFFQPGPEGTSTRGEERKKTHTPHTHKTWTRSTSSNTRRRGRRGRRRKRTKRRRRRSFLIHAAARRRRTFFFPEAPPNHLSSFVRKKVHRMSLTTVAPPTLTFLLQRNRRFRNQLQVVSPEMRCPSTPRRHRSIDLFFCTQENIRILFFST